MKDSMLKEKSYKFALRMIKLFQYLCGEKKEFVLSKQVLRSGTSIGANIEEAYQGESKADFIHKLAIANKEAFETHYWLRLLRDSSLLEEKLANSLIADCAEFGKTFSVVNQNGENQKLINTTVFSSHFSVFS